MIHFIHDIKPRGGTFRGRSIVSTGALPQKKSIVTQEAQRKGCPHHVFSTPRRQLFESIDQASSKLTLSHHSQLALSPNLKSYSPAVKLPYLLIHVANRNPSRRSERRESIPTVKAASFPPLMQYLPAGEFECGLASQSEGVTFARFGEA